MIFAALHVLLAYQGHSFEREEPRYLETGVESWMRCVRGGLADRRGDAKGNLVCRYTIEHG